MPIWRIQTPACVNQLCSNKLTVRITATFHDEEGIAFGLFIQRFQQIDVPQTPHVRTIVGVFFAVTDSRERPYLIDVHTSCTHVVYQPQNGIFEDLSPTLLAEA